MNRGQGPKATSGKPFITRGSGSSGTGAVTSVNGATGAVTGLAPTASPTFTGTVDASGATVTLPSGLVLPASVVIPTSAVATTQSASDNSTKVATTAYAKSQIPITPDRIPANAPLHAETGGGTGSNFGGITVLKPIFWPIDLPGIPGFVASNIGLRVSVLLNASTIGAAIYSVTYPSSAHVSATLVAQLNASQSGSATGRFNPALTTGAAGSGAAALTMDFTTTRYLIGAMVSDVTTLKLIGSAGASADAGLGIISWTGAARSAVTDWPASFTEAANIAAVTAATPFPVLDLVSATGAFYL